MYVIACVANLQLVLRALPTMQKYAPPAMKATTLRAVCASRTVIAFVGSESRPKAHKPPTVSALFAPPRFSATAKIPFCASHGAPAVSASGSLSRDQPLQIASVQHACKE
jgi:hypothetical protein